MDENKNAPQTENTENTEKTEKPVKKRVRQKLLKPDVNVEEIKAETEKSPQIKKADFVESFENVNAKTVGKEVIVPHVLGIKKDETANINKRQKVFKTIVSILFIVFVVGVLAFTFYKDFFANDQDFPSWKEMKYILKVGWIFLLAAFFSLFLCYLFKALKLSVLCKSLTGRFHFITCFETGIIGHYYNCVTPLAVGGQPFEIYHLSKHGIHGGVASSLPIATYSLNQFAFVIFGIVSLALFKNNKLGIESKIYYSFPPTFKVLAIIGLSFCMLLPILVILFSLLPKFGAKIVHFVMFIGGKLRIIKKPKETEYKTVKNIIHNSQCLKKIFSRPLAATACFLLSLLEQVASVSIAYFSLKTFGFGTLSAKSVPPLLEWAQIAQLVTLLNFAVSFIPTPGNSGAADLSFYLLFSSSLAAGMSFPAMSVWRLLAFYSYIIIGFIFATLKKRADKRKEIYPELPE